MPSKLGAQTDDPPMYRIFWSAEEFQKLFRYSIFLHAIPISLLLMFYPGWLVLLTAFFGILVWVWAYMTAKKAFDYLTSNAFHCCTIHAMVALYFAIGYIGACYQFSEGKVSLFVALAAIGILSWYFTVTRGFAAGMRIHERFQKKRTSSIDWDSGIYDIHSHSLDSVDLNAAILGSFPTWKLFAGMVIALSPGPVVAIMAGKVSTHAQYMVAIPTAWGATMTFGYFLMRVALDYWTMRLLEKQKNMRILLSTSKLANQP